MLVSESKKRYIDFIPSCPWKWLLGIACLSILIILVDTQVGWNTTLGNWKQLSTQTLFAAFGLFLLSHVLRGLRIYELIKQKIPEGRPIGLIKISATHQFANNLLPMRLGEAAFPLLMKHYFNESWQQSVPKLLWLRLLDLSVIGVIIYGLLLSGPMADWLLKMTLLVVLMLGLSYWLCRNHFHKIKFPPVVVKIYHAIMDALPENSVVACKLFGYTLLAWFCKLCAITTIIRGFLDLTLAQSLSGALGSELGSILPVHGVGGAGTFEASFLAGMALVQQPGPEFIALAVNVHIFIFASTSLIALLLSPVKVLRNQ